MNYATKHLPHYTYTDYCQWQGDWELIEGIPYAMTPTPVKIHQLLAAYLFMELQTELKNCSDCEILLDTDWKINESTTVRPDVAVVCNDQNPNYISKTPELVIEIISPSSARRDEQLKYHLYAEEGVKYYILVYPNELLAKIYQHNGESFRKTANCDTESFHLKQLKCPTTIDFNKVFKRFR